MTTVKLKSDGGDYFYKQKRWWMDFDMVDSVSGVGFSIFCISLWIQSKEEHDGVSDKLFSASTYSHHWLKH
jgi:hypothetical protein